MRVGNFPYNNSEKLKGNARFQAVLLQNRLKTGIIFRKLLAERTRFRNKKERELHWPDFFSAVHGEFARSDCGEGYFL